MNGHKRVRSGFGLVIVASVIALVAPLTKAGGPLVVLDNQPVKWASTPVIGGALNSQTVAINPDGSRRILYHVDSGSLGTLDNSEAVEFVDRIFGLYTGIPTASIEFVNAGPIINPNKNKEVDVSGDNVGTYIGSVPTFQNPIIFDSDGSITGSGGVLGFFGFLQMDRDSATLQEAFVVLNGRPLTTSSLSEPSFLGVFTHEFGHFAGPLDHAQINGRIAANNNGVLLPPGFTPQQAYDLYAPFTETLYPFIFPAPPGSQLGSQFPDSGFFVATPDMDTQNALSNLYPTADYLTTTGGVEGRVVVRLDSGDVPITGVNVVARRLSSAGGYPPAPDTQAFPTPPVLDSAGVPSIPQDQAATDPLKFVSSAVTGVEFGAGVYRIQGLPPGQYLIEIQSNNPDAVAGSSIGPLRRQLPLPVEEYFNGANESATDDPIDFVPVTVSAGAIATGIDLILNGIDGAGATLVQEQEPNEKKNKEQNLTVPVELTGSVNQADDAKLKMNLPDGSSDKIEDLFRFNVAAPGTYFVFLDPVSGSGDLDVYLFDSAYKKKKSSLNDPHLLSFSAGPTANEFFGVALTPGEYIIGISSFEGSLTYRLRIIRGGS